MKRHFTRSLSNYEVICYDCYSKDEVGDISNVSISGGTEFTGIDGDIYLAFSRTIDVEEKECEMVALYQFVGYVPIADVDKIKNGSKIC